ncbi:MAG: hypothetical protein U9R01_07050 [candidate division WOR-3 bacterium]|nr:hypothetical protein [candidate division WOR-3 bacterium]
MIVNTVKDKIKTANGKEIEIERMKHLPYPQRNAIMDKAVEGKMVATGERAIIHYGALLQATIETVITKLPEGITINDIDNTDLDRIFQNYAAEFGFGKKKVMEQSK